MLRILNTTSNMASGEQNTRLRESVDSQNPSVKPDPRDCLPNTLLNMTSVEILDSALCLFVNLN